MSRRSRSLVGALAGIGTAALLVGATIAPAAAESHDGTGTKPPQLGAASPGTLEECEALLGFQYASTVIVSASVVPAGALSNGGQPIGEHCLVRGRMQERVSTVDGKTYAIGFEMRLPVDWSGRYLYQANGGLDGNVVTAIGGVGGGESGLQMGMAVISSDAGHAGNQNPTFGIDPQARLDYGYQAVGTLTPMAKALVEAAYGRAPDRSYMTGGSNGGRHTMVGAARYADEYDGFLAVAPGFNLPEAAVAQIWGAQQYATVATSTADLSTAFTPSERAVVANAILEHCDALDGLVDGMVQAHDACAKRFSLDWDVPTCSTDRDGTCLTTEQKSVVASIFSGATTSGGQAVYSSFPLDPGITQAGWANWEFNASVTLDPAAVGFVFTTPPADPGILADLRSYALGLDIDATAAGIHATSGIYAESSMSFMTPPNPTDLDTLRDRGAKLIVVHGASDAVFSADDTASWYDALDDAYHNAAGDFARYFEVPGMGHVRGGPATDQYQALAALVRWVEVGDAPERLVASVNPANAEVPKDWSPTRTRPLCVYPEVATYAKGDPEAASSFVCANPSNGVGGRGTASADHPADASAG